MGSYTGVRFLLENEDVTIRVLSTVGAMLGAALVMLLGAKVFMVIRDRRQEAPKDRAFRKIRTRALKLRRQGKLTNDISFAEAVELVKTGTLTPKTLPEMIRDTAQLLQYLYEDEEHGSLFQYEMGSVTVRDIEMAEQAAEALQQAPVVQALRDTRALYEEFRQTRDTTPERATESWYDYMQDEFRIVEHRYRQADASRKYNAAAEQHLAQHAPHLLPLP